MTWALGLGCVGGLLLAAGVASAAELAVPQERELAVRVRIYDYAGVQGATVAGARTVASQVLARAGVLLEFFECRIRQDDPPKDKACELPATPMDLYLRILDLGMARNTGTTRHCLGYAFLAEGFDSTASIFFHRALELEKGNLAPRASILGAMMAHEIGHLLLEQSAHSGNGIMRAHWGGEDLKSIARGRMWFAEDQVSRLTSLVAHRQQASRDEEAIRQEP